MITSTAIVPRITMAWSERVSDERRVRSHVAEQIDRKGWGPVEAAAYGFDRDLVSEFRYAVMFARLCADDPKRSRPEHQMAHRAVRVKECVGLAFSDTIARKLGIGDVRAKYLIDQLDQEFAAHEGLAGAGGE